eukprot:gene17077-23372_t
MFKTKLFSATKESKSANTSGTGLEPLLHVDAHEEGGIQCNDDVLLAKVRELVSSWITSMGKRLLYGSINLINTPMPVGMFEPRSYLEKLADVWVYPRFLELAADATDPVERMKFTVAWFTAGLHHGFEKWLKPFNPILGETWQARQVDGSVIQMEQTSHHPPVSVFHIEGPGGKYRFRGLSQPNLSLMVKYYGFKTFAKGFKYVEKAGGKYRFRGLSQPNLSLMVKYYGFKTVAKGGKYRFRGLSQPNVSLMVKYYGFKTVAKGFRYVEFRDGSRIDIQYPAYVMRGVVRSSRPRAEVEGTATFTYAHAGTSQPRGPPSRPQGQQERDEFESASETDYTEDESPLDKAKGGTAEKFNMDDFLDQPNQKSDVNSVAKSGGSKGMFSGLTKMMGYAAPELEDPEVSLGAPVCRLEGSWLSHLACDGKMLWVLRDEPCKPWIPLDDALPSDSRYRLDLSTLRSGDVKQAQVMKEKLENRQRADKKLREEGGGSDIVELRY